MIAEAPLIRRAHNIVATQPRNISRKHAAHLGLPWAPPPDLKSVFNDGYEQAAEYYDFFHENYGYGDIEAPECPWPINSVEGRSWIEGWNDYCRDNHEEDGIR